MKNVQNFVQNANENNIIVMMMMMMIIFQKETKNLVSDFFHQNFSMRNAMILQKNIEMAPSKFLFFQIQLTKKIFRKS